MLKNDRQPRVLTVSAAAVTVRSERVIPTPDSNEMRHLCMPFRSPFECRSRRTLDSAARRRDRNTTTRQKRCCHGTCRNNQRKNEEIAETDLQSLLHVFERAIDGDIKQCPSFLRKLFEPRAREPFRDILNFVCIISGGGNSKSETERTYWKCVNEKCTGNLDPLGILYCVFCRLQESIFVRLDV